MHKLVLVGELDRASTATFEAAIEGICETEAKGITLDLSELSYIDVTGVAVIVFRCRWCQRRGYEVALIPGSPAIQAMFELTGASRRLPFAEHAPAVEGSPALTEVTPSAVACARTGARGQRVAPAVSRPRSVTLLRVSGRRGRARTARLRRDGR